jgi:hypothetical protein
MKGCTKEDQIVNEDTRQELQIFTITEAIIAYREQRLVHTVERMEDERWDMGRPRK